MVGRGRISFTLWVVLLLLAKLSFAQGTATEDAPKNQPPEAESPTSDSDWGEGSDALGFGGAPAPDAGVATAPTAPSPPEAVKPSDSGATFEAGGFVRSDWGAWAERLTTNPLAKGRQSIDLSVRYRAGNWRAVVGGHLEYDLAYSVNAARADPATREVYERLADLRETYVQGTFGPVDVTVGRQVVAWGEGDMLSPVDVVNPRDLREPGLADLDDLRLPVWSARTGLFAGDHRVELMMIFAPDFGYRSPPLGDFSPLGAVIRAAAQPVPELNALLASAPARYREQPSQAALNTQQYLARWVYRGPSIDLALYAASVLDRQGVVTGVELETNVTSDLFVPGAPTQRTHLVLIQQHPRYWLLGHSGTLPLGDVLLKWEAFGNIGRAYNAGTFELPNLQLRGEAVNLAGFMAGATYTGVTDLRLDLELTKAWQISGATDLLFAADEPVVAARASYALPRQHLSFEAMAAVFGWLGRQGWMARAFVTYSLFDGFALSAGGIHYSPGAELGPLTGFNTHDRVVIKARYDFTL